MRDYHKINTMFLRDNTPQGRSCIMPGHPATAELAYLWNNVWEFTEKVDGTNIRVALEIVGDRAEVTYGGKTDDAMISSHMLRYLDAQFRSEDGLARFTSVFPRGGVVLYGEGCGDKINRQGARTYGPTADFVLFDVEVASEEGWLWLERGNVNDVAYNLGLQSVPVISMGTLDDAAELVKTEAAPSRWGDFPVEGLVARPVAELQTRRGHRIITKIKGRDFAQLERRERAKGGKAIG